MRNATHVGPGNRSNSILRTHFGNAFLLFQQHIFSIGDADSILVAEKMGRDDCVPCAPLIEPMNAHHVRTALCYTSCYVNVTHAFKISGLADMLSVIEQGNQQPKILFKMPFLSSAIVTGTDQIRFYLLPKLNGSRSVGRSIRRIHRKV